MRVALDVRPALSRPTGVGVYIGALAGLLPRLDPESRFTLFSSSLRERWTHPLAGPNVDLLDRRVNPRLTMFMADHPGLESGFMIAHVSAAALASSVKTLAHPALVDSIPTSAGQEDHVSMAPWAGEKLLTMCDRAASVLAIEFLAAAHAIDVMRPLHTSAKLEVLHGRIRERVPFRREDPL